MWRGKPTLEKRIYDRYHHDTARDIAPRRRATARAASSVKKLYTLQVFFSRRIMPAICSEMNCIFIMGHIQCALKSCRLHPRPILYIVQRLSARLVCRSDRRKEPVDIRRPSPDAATVMRGGRAALRWLPSAGAGRRPAPENCPNIWAAARPPTILHP